MGRLAKDVTKKWKDHAPQFWWGNRLDSRYYMVSRLRSMRNKRILDIGCNVGIMLSELDRSNLKVGIDLSQKALDIARELIPEASLSLADMYNLPYPDDFFDVVIFCGMLEVPPWELKGKALKEAHRVLRSEGVFLLTTPNRNYWAYRNNKNMINYEELKELLGPSFSFTIKGINPFPPFPLFLPNRILARIPGIWGLILFAMELECLFHHCHSFYVEATKKQNIRTKE